MPRQKTIKRFEQWKLEAANIDEFFRLIEGVGVAKPLRFRDACVALKVPYTLMHAHMKETPALKARYDAVRAANADQFAHEAVAIADGADDESKAGVAKAKLQVDTRLALASKWDRGDYGETLRVERAQEVPSDAGLLGFASELLKLVKRGGADPALAEIGAAGPEKLIGGGSAAEPERVAGAAATALARAAAE